MSCSVFQTVSAIYQFIGSLFQRRGSAFQLFCSIFQTLCSVFQITGSVLQVTGTISQFGGAFLQIIGTIVKFLCRIFDLIGFVIKLIHIHGTAVNIKGHGNCLEGNCLHPEIFYLCGDGELLFISCYDIVKELTVGTYIGCRCAFRLDIAAFPGIQCYRSLYQIIFEEGVICFFIFLYCNLDLKFSAFPGKIICGYFFSLQLIADGNIPWYFRIFQISLIIEFSGRSLDLDFISGNT